MFVVRCSDCYVVDKCCELDDFRRVWDIRDVNIEGG